MFDLKSIRLAPGDHQRRDVEVAIPPITFGGLVYRVEPDPTPVRLDLDRLRSGLVLQLRLVAEVHGTCHRCLGEAVVRVDAQEREFQADDPDPGAADEMTSEYVDVAAHEVDVDRWASDAVVLSLPTTILCKADCAGLCPQCGADLNQGPCGCPPPATDERWSKLRELLPTIDDADDPGGDPG